MKTITVHAAETQLSKLIERACAGEEIVIAHRRARVDDAFFEPLPPEELAAWE